MPSATLRIRELVRRRPWDTAYSGGVVVLVQDVSRFPFTHTAVKFTDSARADSPDFSPLTAPEKRFSGAVSGL